ncbi:beta-1,4-xylosyltransferase IRX9 isoform X2 [Elaeis guineensis]|uniref:Glycosyltransferases n=1 Tax=Elaeis guineensis var. tenera TaxID=51953 RepID=A0A6I9R5C6_ELAGV|nr:probable beta-1,4-xylosyltransferase IRX9 isoform X2 [Elaeis guineensis]
MGSFDRSKKRIQLWKKALLHFSLCFAMGFFTGFAPTSTASLFSGQLISYRHIKNLGISAEPASLNRNLMAKISTARDPTDTTPKEEPRNLLIVITTTRSEDRFQGAFLTRLAQTLRLVPPPLLWIVVQAHSEAPATADMLRKTGIMYRHLTFKENFTDAEAEADHQRNVALGHIEDHRLTGIVHFAGISNIYDPQLFEEIREIEVFGTWPVAMVSANRKRVVVEGPSCNSSKVVGWPVGNLSCGTANEGSSSDPAGLGMASKPARINVSGFAFNSSVLWDPDRWGRPTTMPDTSQDSFKFVQEVIVEDENKLKCIPPDNSKIMLWHLHIPRVIPLPFRQKQNKR